MSRILDPPGSSKILAGSLGKINSYRPYASNGVIRTDDDWYMYPPERLVTVVALTAGGSNEPDGALASVERFDLDRNQWTEVVPMEKPRAGLAVAVSSGLLYVFGGRTTSEEYSPPVTLTGVDMYDPKKKKWKHVTDLCFSRCDFGIGIV